MSENKIPQQEVPNKNPQSDLNLKSLRAKSGEPGYNDKLYHKLTHPKMYRLDQLLDFDADVYVEKRKKDFSVKMDRNKIEYYKHVNSILKFERDKLNALEDKMKKYINN